MEVGKNGGEKKEREVRMEEETNAEFLRRVRKMVGLSQRQLAWVCGFSREAVCRAERGASGGRYIVKVVRVKLAQGELVRRGRIWAYQCK